jgi:hypothetical protein
MRTEGMGIRASGRVLEKSHTSIMRWEQKLANQSQQWSPPAPAGSDITVEGDEVYTRVSENLPRHSSNVKVAIGLRQEQEPKPLNYLLKPQKQHGNGQRQVNTFDGLLMEKDATLSNCGKGQVCTSNPPK